MTDDTRTAVQVLAGRALDEVDLLTARLVPVLVAAEPDDFYDEEAVRDLHGAVRDAFVGILAVLRGGGPGALDPFEAPRAAGRRQLQQALPLEGVLRSYRAAGQAVWEHLVLLAQDQGRPVAEDLLHGASEVWRVIDRFCTTAAEAYRREEGLLRERDSRVQSAVLAALLEGRGADPLFARDATSALGLPATGPYVCVVGLPDSLDELALEHPRERLAMSRVASAWTSYGGADVGLVALGTRPPEEVRALVAASVRARAGMSPPFTAILDVPRARHLAETAARCPGPPRSVRLLEDDLLAGLVVEAPLLVSMLYDRSLGRLLAADDQGDDGLLATLRVFLAEGGSLNNAAAKSYVHRNTMNYRLNKIERLTGLSVRHLHDQVLWVLALKEHDARHGLGPAVRQEA